jgi:hypothetical protein
MNRMSSLSQPRQSTTASGQASSVAQQRYVDKKAEYEGVTALNAASELMVQQLEEIASRTDLMADGGVGESSYYCLERPYLLLESSYWLCACQLA